MEKNDDKRQQLIREVLAIATATSHTEALARGIRAWEQLAAHLSPLIGEAGFCALYGRAQRLSSTGDDRRTANSGLRSTSVLLEKLRHNWGAMEPAAANLANAAVLETFTKLLSGLIGEALTTRLLNTAWADRPEGKST
jgi:hypothetical protein